MKIRSVIILCALSVAFGWLIAPRPPNSVSQSTPAAAGQSPQTPKLELESHQFTWEGSGKYQYISGVVKNNSNATVKSARLNFKLYGSDGIQTDTAWCYVKNIAPGDRCRFQATARADKYTFAGITDYYE